MRARRRRAHHDDYAVVYLIAADDLEMVKIGRSTVRGVVDRVAALQTGSPVALSLVHSVPAPEWVETHLHERFKAHHVRGEWFRDVPEIRAWFNECAPLLEEQRAMSDGARLLQAVLSRSE